MALDTSQPPIANPQTPSPVGEPVVSDIVQPRGAFRALKHRNYRLFFVGQLISVIGTWMQDTALKLLVVRLFASPAEQAAWLGAVSFIPIIPLVPVALIGGSLVDRFPRRTLVIFTQATMMIQALLLFALTASGVITIGHVLLLSMLAGVANAVDVPARQTLVMELVGGNRDDLPGAIALNSSIFNLGRAIGPAIAGIIVAAVGEADAFLLNALSFVAVLIGLLLMRLPPRSIVKQPRIDQHLKDGFRYIRSQQTILVLYSLITISALLAMPFTQLLPLFAKYTLADSAAPLTAFVCSRIECATPEALTLGLLNALFGLGAFGGALIAAGWAREQGRGRLLTLGNLGFPAALLAFALSRSFALSLGLLFCVGVGWTLQNALINTRLQLTAPDEVRGRVMSMYSMLFQGMFRVGGLMAGLVAAIASAPFTIGLGALLALSYGAFAALRWPEVRRQT
jgi:MFS family permease